MAVASASRSRSRRRDPATRAADAAARVRWDRLGRAAMLCVLAALLGLYLSAGIHVFSTWRQSHREAAAVAALEREHHLLAAEHERLARQETLEGEARQLGMMKKGEQAYVVSGLPAN